MRERSYDPAAGRWLAEDPEGYGPDPNLYRYASNDPVNLTDPSGRAVLTPYCPDKLHQAREQLHKEFRQAYGGMGLKVIKEEEVERPGLLWSTKYWQLDLYDAFTPEIWREANRCLDRGCGGLAGSLAQHTNDALSGDYVIRRRGSGDSARLDWSRLSGGSVWQSIGQVLAQVGGAIAGIADVVLAEVRELAQVAFAKLLEAANVPAGQLKSAVEAFGSLTEILGLVARDPLGFASNLLQGGKEALGWLLEKGGDLVKEAADLVKRLEGKNIWDVLKEVAATFVRLAGLSKEAILGRVTARLPDALKGKVGPVAQEVEKLLGDGGYQRLSNLLGEFNETVKEDLAKLRLSEVIDWVKDSLPGAAKEWLVTQGVVKLVGLLFPAASGLKALYDGLSWAAGNLKGLTDLVETLAGALKAAAVRGKEVATLLLGGLQKGTRLLLGLLAEVLKLNNLADLVLGCVKALLAWLKEKLYAFLDWLLDKAFKKKGVSCPLPGAKGGRAGMRPRCGGKCFEWAMPLNLEGGMAPIGVECVGRRTRPGETKAGVRGVVGELWRVRLSLDYGGGDGLDAVLLRGRAWLREQRCWPGGLVRLDLPEMGASGWAKVLSVEPCPWVEEGEGGLITGWFHHRRSVLFDLRVDGEEKALGVTAKHPFWSEDRGAWVPACELRKGERLQGMGEATPRVQSLRLRAGAEPVYTIEVEGEHCYRVGTQGLLVHNASAKLQDFLQPSDSKRTKEYVEPGAALRKGSSEYAPLFKGYRNLGVLYYKLGKDSTTLIRLPSSGFVEGTNPRTSHAEQQLLKMLPSDGCGIPQRKWTGG